MKTKYLFLAIMIGLIGISWYQTVNVASNTIMTYKNEIKKAKQYDEKGFYVEAIECYEKAYEKNKKDISIRKNIALDYLALEDYESFEEEAIFANKLLNGDEQLYEALGEFYLEQNEIISAVDTLKEGMESYPKNQKMKELFDSVKGEFEVVKGAFENVTDFRNGLSKVEKDGMQGIMTSSGGELVQLGNYYEIYDFINDEDSIYVSANRDDIPQLFDKNGYLRLSPDTKYEYLGVESCGKILVKKSGKWGYLDSDFKENNIEYEQATKFLNNRAAVKKNGKWAIINEQLKPLTEFEYEDVLIDDSNTCSMVNRIWVKKDGMYILLDEKCKKVADGFENAKPFVRENGLAAICQKGKWGLIDNNGEIQLKCEYDELNSSNGTFAAFRKGQKWGFITTDGEVYIEPQFYDAKTFNAAGYVWVKDEENWSIIRLEILQSN